jgi:hypothetical protein
VNRTQVCVNRTQVCVNRTQECVNRTQVCVNRTQVCVNRTQVCVNLNQVCVNLTQVEAPPSARSPVLKVSTSALAQRRKSCGIVTGWDFRWEVAPAAVSRRPPIPLDTMVARTGGYAYDVGVWGLSIVQGPFSAVPNLKYVWSGRKMRGCMRLYELLTTQ